MTVREVAAYLSIKERKVYDLIKQGRIPCSRVTGKWLFPRRLIELWVAEHTAFASVQARDFSAAPPVLAGSHDPLLEWALRASDCGLAMLAEGSLEGLTRLAAGEAQVCGVHILQPEDGGYNVQAVTAALPGRDIVVLEWAWRRQGLVLAPHNPLNIQGLGDVVRGGHRFMGRQAQAGTSLLLEQLLAADGLVPGALNRIDEVARTQTDVGLAVLDGRADVGLAVEAVARQLRLAFVPLHRERYDLVLSRRAYFEPPLQALAAFTRGEAFARQAAALGGYELAGQWTPVYNSA